MHSPHGPPPSNTGPLVHPAEKNPFVLRLLRAMSFNYEDVASDVPYSLWSMLAPAGGVIALSCLAWYGYRHVAFTLEENRKELSVLRSALAQRDAEVLSLRKALSEPTQQVSSIWRAGGIAKLMLGS